MRAYLPLNPGRGGGTPGSPLPTLYCTLGPCFSSAHETFISARNIHRKISALMGKSIAYQSTIAIEVTECKCVNATLHRKRYFIFLPSVVKSGKLLGCKLFTETVSSFVFHFFLLEPQNCTNLATFSCVCQTKAVQLLLNFVPDKLFAPDLKVFGLVSCLPGLPSNKGLRVSVRAFFRLQQRVGGSPLSN